MVIGLLIAAVVVLLGFLVWKNRNLPPGPWGLPILGYLPWLDAKNPYLTLTNLSEKYGKIYGLSLGSIYTVVLTDPKVIKNVFSKDVTTGRAPLYLTHGIMDGYGLICSQGDLWKEHRRFTFHCLRQFGATKVGSQRAEMEALILKHCHKFTDYLEDTGLNTEVDILPALRHSLGSVINAIVFGVHWERDNELWNWLLHLQEEGPKYLGVAGAINFLPFLRFLPKFQKIINFMRDGKTKTHEEYKKIIKEQEQLLEDTSTPNEAKVPTNIIQAFLLEKQKKNKDIAEYLYCDQQFWHLLGDIFGASLDTTMTTLRWYYLYLAKYPEIQKEVRKELEDVLQGRQPTIDDLTNLPITEASILECMRIRPVVPVGIPHGALEDIEIEGFKVPKGTMLVPLQWALHMNNNVWENPSEYNPKRFINADGRVEKPEYFMPFQVGKRMCVGYELAGMFIFFFGATLLQRFSLSLADHNIDLWGECGITLTPKDHKFLLKSLNKVRA